MTETRIPHIETFDSRGALAARAAEEIAGRVKEAIATRGRALLALAGGRTPAPIYRLLRDADIDWSKTIITMTDERCVAPENAASNARLLRETLLQGRAAAARFVPLYDNEETPEAAARAAHARLSEAALPFDVVLLGMGADMHTASLFPHADGLAAALETNGEHLAAAVTPSPPPADAPFPRVTLTLPALAGARRSLLVITGAVKHAAFARAFSTDPAAAPVRAVTEAAGERLGVWYAD